MSRYRVTLSLQRLSDKKYWTGSAWGARTQLSTTPGNLNGAATFTWERTTGLPTVTNDAATGLEEGKFYVLQATAFDRAGLHTAASRRIKIVPPAAVAVSNSQAPSTFEDDAPSE